MDVRERLEIKQRSGIKESKKSGIDKKKKEWRTEQEQTYIGTYPLMHLQYITSIYTDI